MGPGSIRKPSFPFVNTPQKILIRATNWIGDAVMTTPAMRVVRSAFPRAEVTLVANPVVAELFSPHPCCDRVILLDRKRAHAGALGLFRFCAALRRERFDLAILFQNAIEAAIVAVLGGIPNRVGYSTDGRGALLTQRVPVGDAERRLHHTDYYLRMLERSGIRGEHSGALTLVCTEAERVRARETLHGCIEPWVAINPGAAYGSAKRWFPERFAAVADTLAREDGMAILLTGGPGEVDLGREIEAAMRARPLNLIGKTSVRQMMALISQCAMMITNDSGPMHVAAAFERPTVALFGATNHKTTSPLSASCRIVRKPVQCAPCLKRQCPTDHRCMDAITVEDVLDAVRSLPSPPAN